MPQNSVTADRMSNLYAYRKAKGLCYKCGVQFTRGHKCADTVQLQFVEELWQTWDLPASEGTDENSHAELHNLLLSQAARGGSPATKTMKFYGSIQGINILILLDSGSSHTFISSSVAAQLQGCTTVNTSLPVQIANGSRLICALELVQAEWFMNDYQFQSTLKVLPLLCYDIIVGMDWLEHHSPMLVHWADKWLTVPYKGSTIKLIGLQPGDIQCSVMQLCPIEVLPDKDQSIIQLLPPQLQQLLENYIHVFIVPHGLPPIRDCDHHIPLIPGVRPVQVRPYRYAPALKTEIEKQVDEMMQSGIIERSKSEFSSSVILVKKKDGTYRFCVDYRHLNALTAKTKFPVPVIDEFLDELHGAAWFSTLDLRAGFHQIRVAPPDQHKTAFQTHHGHFEFKVMAFGLLGAPATFQGAMNRTLAPLLRHCALVFFDDILVYSRTWEDHLQHLQSVLHLLSTDRWQIKLTKCSFAKQQIAYLGHVISQQGVATDPTKVEAV